MYTHKSSIHDEVSILLLYQIWNIRMYIIHTWNFIGDGNCMFGRKIRTRDFTGNVLFRSDPLSMKYYFCKSVCVRAHAHVHENRPFEKTISRTTLKSRISDRYVGKFKQQSYAESRSTPRQLALCSCNFFGIFAIFSRKD